MSTWFAIHVRPGCEAQAVGLLSASAKDAGLEELFCPMAVFARMENGDLVEEQRPMIPGCVVAVAPSKWEMRRVLRKAADGMEALYGDGASFGAMSDDEARLIGMFTEPGRRTADLSHATVDNGRVTIESGPLAGREQMIAKYNRRRSRAVLDASVAGVPAEAQLGLRVTRKPQWIGSRFSRQGRFPASSGIHDMDGDRQITFDSGCIRGVFKPIVVIGAGVSNAQER